jgi:hypothetical protein
VAECEAGTAAQIRRPANRSLHAGQRVNRVEMQPEQGLTSPNANSTFGLNVTLRVKNGPSVANASSEISSGSSPAPAWNPARYLRACRSIGSSDRSRRQGRGGSEISRGLIVQRRGRQSAVTRSRHAVTPTHTRATNHGGRGGHSDADDDLRRPASELFLCDDRARKQVRCHAEPVASRPGRITVSNAATSRTSAGHTVCGRDRSRLSLE